MFSFAFAIKRKYVLLFGPDDELMTIYRAANHKRLLDNMEFEILAKHMQKKYRVNLEGIWHEHLTLGELFSKTLSVN